MSEEEEIMSTVTTTTAIVLLPQEIIMDILSRVPASSLVSSFKLVCKSWQTLINEPDFIKMHLLNRKAINDGGLICKSGNDLFQLHPPFNFEVGVPAAAAAGATKLDFDSLPLTSRLVGSCNGLLCLSVVNDDDDENIILLNPSTRKYKISPKQPIKCHPITTQATHGFGCCYNNNNNNSTANNNIYDEYKVVRIVYFYSIDQAQYLSSRSQIDIYSMSSNSWRRTDTIAHAFTISINQSGVFVNEALHWVAAASLTSHWVAAAKLASHWDTIISFDIRDEEFRHVPIPLPCEPSSFNLAGVILMNMKGCLSMIRFSHANNSLDDAAADLEIWVMKEYGIKESWTKEFVISSSWDTDPPRALSEFKISSWRSNAYVLKGDQILTQGVRKLVLYDINKRKINGNFEMIGVPDQPYRRIDLVGYIETLVSLKSSIMVHALDSNLSSSSS